MPVTVIDEYSKFILIQKKILVLVRRTTIRSDKKCRRDAGAPRMVLKRNSPCEMLQMAGPTSKRYSVSVSALNLW